jgi:hypothetical protein
MAHKMKKNKAKTQHGLDTTMRKQTNKQTHTHSVNKIDIHPPTSVERLNTCNFKKELVFQNI